jgi:hypothetical protein
MTAYDLKSAHKTRTIKVDLSADGQTPKRMPLRISEGAHSMVLHFKPEEVTERGPEVASILDSALDCYIARLKNATQVEQPDASTGQTLLVGLSSPSEAPRQLGTASVGDRSDRPVD